MCFRVLITTISFVESPHGDKEVKGAAYIPWEEPDPHHAMFILSI